MEKWGRKSKIFSCQVQFTCAVQMHCEMKEHYSMSSPKGTQPSIGYCLPCVWLSLSVSPLTHPLLPFAFTGQHICQY